MSEDLYYYHVIYTFIYCYVLYTTYLLNNLCFDLKTSTHL